MTDDKRDRVKGELLCVYCGEMTPKTLPAGAAWHYRGSCGKCGRDAFPATMLNTPAMIQVLVQRINSLQSSVFDLECAEQERAEPGVETA